MPVDPERDTQELLSKYASGLRSKFRLPVWPPDGDRKGVQGKFRMFYQKVPGNTAFSYSMDHTESSYVFDPKGYILSIHQARASA